MFTTGTYVAVGAGGEIVRWDGTTWTRIVAGFTSYGFNSIHGIDELMYAVGWNDDIFSPDINLAIAIKSEDGGLTWADVTPPDIIRTGTATGVSHITNVWVESDTNIWCAINDCAGGGQLWHYDGVSTWTVVLPANVNRTDICVNTAGHKYLGGLAWWSGYSISADVGAGWVDDLTSPDITAACLWPQAGQIFLQGGGGYSNQQQLWGGVAGAWSLLIDEADFSPGGGGSDDTLGRSIWGDSVTGEIWSIGGLIGGVGSGLIGVYYFDGLVWALQRGSVELPSIAKLNGAYGIPGIEVVAIEHGGTGTFATKKVGGSWEFENSLLPLGPNGLKGIYGYYTNTPLFIRAPIGALYIDNLREIIR